MFDDILRQFPGYQIIKTGGQKTVYKINHNKYGDVVLKIGYLNSSTKIDRISREVRILEDIDSYYYPKQYEFYLHTNDIFVIIEEYILSRSLSSCMSEINSANDVVDLLYYLIIALDILWMRNIIHRDIKPDNILIRPNGIPVIIDLGIARLLDLDSLTKSLAARGPCTPIYASPEQLWNRKSYISHRTDQFCIGIVIAQLLLNGKHPFDPKIVGEGDNIVENILNDKYAKKILSSKVNNILFNILSRLLKHEPYERYPDRQDILNDILTFKELSNV